MAFEQKFVSGWPCVVFRISHTQNSIICPKMALYAATANIVNIWFDEHNV